MADEKHESKHSCYSRHKWLPAAAAILLLVFLAAGFSVRYISFMSQTIYQESTSHLEEVLHKSNNMLKEMVRKNMTYLHLCNGFLKNTSNEDEIQAYIEEAQQATGFVNFYFLSYDGNYTTVTGETGYLGLQTNLDEKLSDGEDIVVNTALPGKAPMLAFICPETQGSYRGFAYDAVAITYYNDAVLRLLDSSAFQGNASNYVIYPDGRVVIRCGLRDAGRAAAVPDDGRPLAGRRTARKLFTTSLRCCATIPTFPRNRFLPFRMILRRAAAETCGSNWATPVIIWSTRIPRSRTGRWWGLCRSASSMPVWISCGSTRCRSWRASPLALLC